jgi:hypothetical protein
MAITFTQLTEAKGKRVRYTFEEDGREVYGSVTDTTPTRAVVQWDDENTPTEYLEDSTLVDLPHMDIMGSVPKTLTRSAITRAIEDAILIGKDLGDGKFTTAYALSKKDELLKTLLG